MDRKDYLEKQRDTLLKAYLNASEEDKRSIMLKIMKIDSETQGKDVVGKKTPGKFTLRRNKIIYINQ
jgi:hypothetical protein